MQDSIVVNEPPSREQLRQLFGDLLSPIAVIAEAQPLDAAQSLAPSPDQTTVEPTVATPKASPGEHDVPAAPAAQPAAADEEIVSIFGRKMPLGELMAASPAQAQPAADASVEEGGGARDAVARRNGLRLIEGGALEASAAAEPGAPSGVAGTGPKARAKPNSFDSADRFEYTLKGLVAAETARIATAAGAHPSAIADAFQQFRVLHMDPALQGPGRTVHAQFCAFLQHLRAEQVAKPGTHEPRWLSAVASAEHAIFTRTLRDIGVANPPPDHAFDTLASKIAYVRQETEAMRAQRAAKPSDARKSTDASIQPASKGATTPKATPDRTPDPRAAKADYQAARPQKAGAARTGTSEAGTKASRGGFSLFGGLSWPKGADKPASARTSLRQKGAKLTIAPEVERDALRRNAVATLARTRAELAERFARGGLDAVQHARLRAGIDLELEAMQRRFDDPHADTRELMGALFQGGRSIRASIRDAIRDARDSGDTASAVSLREVHDDLSSLARQLIESIRALLRLFQRSPDVEPSRSAAAIRP